MKTPTARMGGGVVFLSLESQRNCMVRELQLFEDAMKPTPTPLADNPSLCLREHYQ